MIAEHEVHGKGCYAVWCEGFQCNHIIPTIKSEWATIIWEFNGDLEKPTFTPSVRISYEEPDELNGPRKDRCCHFFITNGMIQYLSDCTHEYAGKTIELKDTK